MPAPGIEEEFLLFDQDALLPVAPTKLQTAALQRIAAAGGETSQELLRCQIEYASAVFEDTAIATDALLTFRQRLASVAPNKDYRIPALTDRSR